MLITHRLGRSRESLIAELLRNTIPKRFEVASGFVLFAMPGQTPVAGPVSDPMRYHPSVPSHQCDVIVYDAANVPVVFRDLNLRHRSAGSCPGGH